MKKAEEEQQGGKTGGVREMGEKGRNKTKNHLLSNVISPAIGQYQLLSCCNYTSD